MSDFFRSPDKTFSGLRLMSDIFRSPDKTFSGLRLMSDIFRSSFVWAPENV
jgi:hypothetical protein